LDTKSSRISTYTTLGRHRPPKTRTKTTLAVALSALNEELVALKTTIEGLKGQLSSKKKSGSGDTWKSIVLQANQAQSK
jgi:hypothetical protein